MKALRNHWYVAAWSDDVGQGLTARTIIGEPVVMYRTENGEPVALADRCPHRYAPLSMGILIGDRIQCAYHGLVFDGSGACRGIPGQSSIPPGAGVKCYPVADRWRWTWIWMGDPELADDSLIPDFHWNDAPDWTMIGGVLTIKAHYQLLVDNLLDLSHEAYLHPRTIGNAAVAEDAVIKTERTERGIRVTRRTESCPTPPLWRRIRGHGDTIDRWQIIDFSPPSFVVLESGSVSAPPAVDATHDDEVTHMAMFAITPETETSSHYFWSNARDYRLDDDKITTVLRDGIDHTFQEDCVMLEAQQRNLELDPDPEFLNINADQGVLQVRRMIEQMLSEEQGGSR